MTTIKQVLILLLLASLAFACKKKPEENPTIFEGKVVYAEDGSSAAGVKMSIIPSLKTTPLTGAKSGDIKTTLTGEEGLFKIEFPYNEEVKYFAIVTTIATTSGDLITFNKGNGLDCSPYDCEDFKPHQNYSNLVIKIPRP